VSASVFDFDFSSEQRLIQDVARAFSRERLLPALRAAEEHGVGEATRAAFREAVLFATDVPEALGGAGLGPIERAIVLEELGAGDAAAAIALDGLGPAAYPLLAGGADAIVAELLRDPDARGWVVLDEEAPRFVVDGGRVRGEWPWVPASRLDALVIVHGETAHVVREGIALAPVGACALDAAGSASVAIDGAPVTTVPLGVRGLAKTRAQLRLHVSALLVGVARASLEHATRYAKERVAFGRPIAHHQSIAFLISEIATRIDAARLSVHRLAWALGEKGDPTEAGAAAYLDAMDAALEAGEQGVQILGGHGYMQDHPVEKWMREARTLSTLFGGRDLALEDLAPRGPASVGFSPPAFAEGA
jgi:alkylation response protein AidB-like acyl-CoA dehydrogenase